MELRHLRYFAAVAEDEHFGRAAERLHVSQSAVSAQVQALEEEMGVTLFERLPRGVRLSGVGTLFLQDVRQILTHAKLAVDRAQRAARGELGSLRLGCTEAASWHGVVPDSLNLFRRSYPDIGLEFFPMTSALQLEAIRLGTIDAGFFYYSLTEGSPFMAHHAVQLNNVVVALPSTHPLAARRTVRLQDLKDQDFVWPMRANGPQYHDRLMQACVAGGLSPRIRQETVNETTALSLVSAGMGIAILTSSVQWRLPERVVVRQVKGLSVPFPLELVCRTDNDSVALANFIKVVNLASRAHEKANA